MKALVLCDKNKFELREIEAPVALADQVLVRVNAVGLCGTDFHIFEGRANYHTDERGSRSRSRLLLSTSGMNSAAKSSTLARK